VAAIEPAELKITVSIEDDIVVARQKAREFAKSIGLGVVDQSRVATAVSELTRNVIRYATDGRGEVYIRYLGSPSRSGIEIVVADHQRGVLARIRRRIIGIAVVRRFVAVRETVAKIMRSLPELRKFQVVAFSNKAIFPLGKNGEWLDFDPATSADLVLKTLAAIKPNGGTNMYGAMEAVFRMRPQGLDTVYFCSDGIPNLGEGVTPEEIKADKLTDVEVGTRLGAAVRKKLKTDWNRDLDGKPRVRLNTVGFFYESPDVGAFLWALARENEGSFVGMSKP